MSIFGNIMGKIFHHGQNKPAASTGSAAPQAQPTPAASTAPTALPAPAQTQSVDVGAVLSELASLKNGGGNYQSSIVDLLKLLDLDSSLAARKELAGEMNVHADADGTAEQNVALHKAVMAKLAQNGGVVPDSLRN